MGGARTALVNWLIARKQGGVFVLRIEDTDLERSKPELTQGILDGMKWLGIDWDEGPLLQSDRVPAHRELAEQLLQSGNAYRCFCSKEELDERRKSSGKGVAWKYDGACRELNRAEIAHFESQGKTSVVRFKVPEGETAWEDLVHGRVAVQNREIDDFILLRTGGQPVYMIAVVADDIFSRITHVFRGDDHISNTPKQILLYQALNAPVPAFGHLPLILGPDKKRLSKRHGATSVTEYAAMGILPESLFAFLAQLGISYGDEIRPLSQRELIDGFDFSSLKKSASVFDLAKLAHLNAQNIGLAPIARLQELLASRMQGAGIIPAEPRYSTALALMRTRARDLNDLINFLRPFFNFDFPYEEVSYKKLATPECKALLEKFLPRLEAAQPFDAVTLEAALRECTDQAGVKAAALIHPLRLALLGVPVSPGIFEVIVAMGRTESIERIKRFMGAIT